jgi:hypothetical protein
VSARDANTVSARDANTVSARDANTVSAYDAPSGENTEASDDRDTKAASNSNNKIKRPEPSRPCPFCCKMQTKLSRHIKLMHKCEKEVGEIYKLPQKDQIPLLRQLKRKGILQYNLKKLRKGSRELLVEKRSSTEEQGSTSFCQKCNGFFNKKFYSAHNCCSTSPSKALKLNAKHIHDQASSQDFRNNILEKFRRTDTGNLCRNDTLIKLIGFELYNPQNDNDKLPEMRRKTMATMRNLAHIAIKMRKYAEENNKTFTTLEIFRRKSIRNLEKCINELCCSDGQVKNGMKVQYFFTLITATQTLKTLYLMEERDEEASQMELFRSCLSSRWPKTFKGSENANKKRRGECLRLPARIPKAEDMNSLRNFMRGQTKPINVLPHSCNPHASPTPVEEPM